MPEHSAHLGLFSFPEGYIYPAFALPFYNIALFSAWPAQQQNVPRQAPQQSYYQQQTSGQGQHGQQYQQQTYTNAHGNYKPPEKMKEDKMEEKKNPWLKGCLIAFGVISLLVLLIIAIGISSSKPIASVQPQLTVGEIKNQAVAIPYDDLMRNNSTYAGKIAYYRGKIVQVSEAFSDAYVLRVNTKTSPYLGYISDTLWIDYKGTRLLEGDVVDIWGKVDGLKTYTAVLGNEITIPELISLHLEIFQKAGDESTSSINTLSSSNPAKTGKVTIKYSLSTAEELGTFNKASSGKIYLIANFNIENNGYESFDVGPYYIKAVINGAKYDYSFDSYALDNSLSDTELMDGGKINGKLAFEVPVQANYSAVTFVYDDILDTNYNIDWIVQ